MYDIFTTSNTHLNFWKVCAAKTFSKNKFNYLFYVAIKLLTILSSNFFSLFTLERKSQKSSLNKEIKKQNQLNAPSTFCLHGYIYVVGKIFLIKRFLYEKLLSFNG